MLLTILTALLQSIAEEARPFVEPAVSTLAKTIIGALLVISWVITLICLWVVYKAQEARIADQKAINEKSLALNEKSLQTLNEFKTALEGLRQSDQAGQVIIQGMKSSFDLFVSTQAYRRHTPGMMPAQRDPRGGR